jgi:hypothetical protein
MNNQLEKFDANMAFYTDSKNKGTDNLDISSCNSSCEICESCVAAGICPGPGRFPSMKSN